VAEHIDVHAHRDTGAINGLISDLVSRNLLTGEEAAAIDREKIAVFTRSEVAERMRAAARVYREVPFVMETPDFEEAVLVHGIIDCYFEEDGKMVLVDYKSDAVYGDPRKWAESHRTQLDIYKKAVTESTGMEVKEVLLYSFGLGECFQL
jgi:ATP-dependent helicase/nuclease subunit A